MARVYKKLSDYKTNESAAEEKGAIVTGACEIVGSSLVITLPLKVTEEQVRLYDDEVERNGKKEIVPKGNLVTSVELPEGLELTVDGVSFRVKRGGMAAKRYLTLGFDPTKGFKHIQPEEAEMDEAEMEAATAPAH